MIHTITCLRLSSNLNRVRPGPGDFQWLHPMSDAFRESAEEHGSRHDRAHSRSSYGTRYRNRCRQQNKRAELLASRRIRSARVRGCHHGFVLAKPLEIAIVSRAGQLSVPVHSASAWRASSRCTSLAIEVVSRYGADDDPWGASSIMRGSGFSSRTL